jgi:hypothetical protein
MELERGSRLRPLPLGLVDALKDLVAYETGTIDLWGSVFIAHMIQPP